MAAAGGAGPERENTLRSALASSMLGLNARDIDALNKTNRRGMRWWKSLSLPANLAKARRDGDAARADDRAAHCREYAGDPRRRARLTDILHISELLQEAAYQLESEHALVRWLAQHIADPDSNASSQQMRLESDKHLVQIVTIHKSKGLEYPLVWLPFIAVSVNRIRRFTTIANSFAAVLDLSRRRPALSWRRPNVWRKICACCTSR
jgi:exodeoxyribonuclease V beta subunit